MNQDQHPVPIANVVAWTFNPDPRDAIYDLLKALDDDQLHTLMTRFPGAAGTLGWLEFGRRRGHIAKLHFQVVEVKGKFEVNVGFPAPAVVENITLGHKWDGD